MTGPRSRGSRPAKTPVPRNRRKPPPPIRHGPTRSTFDGCAVVAVLFLITALAGPAVLLASYFLY